MTRPVTSLTVTSSTAAATLSSAVRRLARPPRSPPSAPPEQVASGPRVRRLLLGARQSDRERARGAAAVADRVLLLRARARPSCARRRDSRPGRRRGRSRTRRCRAARGSGAPRSDPCTTSSRPARLDVGHARRRRRPACRRRAAPRAAASRGSPRRWRPRPRSAPTRPRARRSARPPRCPSRRRSPGARSPPAAARALPSAFSANVVPRLGRQLDLVGQRLELVRAHRAPKLAQLVLVAGGDDESHRV